MLSVLEENILIEQALQILEGRLKDSDCFTVTGVQCAKKYVELKLTEKEHEVFSVMFLDRKNRLIEYVEMFKGTIDGCSIYAREIVKTALRYNAATVIIAHNHPSGVSDPSSSDLNITNKLVDALKLIDVKILDHLIVGNNSTVSFAERGLI